MRKLIFAALLTMMPQLPEHRTPVVLISIDGLKPDYVLEADKHGLRIPNLRQLVSEGTYSSGVTGVVPTVTYPSHTTMVTGVSPARHGIQANTPFDPLGKNMGGWYWYADDIQTPTLWDAASRAGLVTSSVHWPVTVGANIDHNLPQYWRAGTPDDVKILRTLSTRGLFAEVEQAVGSYPDGVDETVESDLARVAFNEYLIDKYRPALHLAYFTGLDHQQHETGPYTAGAFEALERIDQAVGRLRAAAEKSGNGSAYVCVVSDHGFFATSKELHLNSALREAGMIDLDEKGAVRSWRAFAWNSGGSAAIILQTPDDASTRQAVGQLLRQLSMDPDSGIDAVLEEETARKTEGFPTAAFIVAMKEGYRAGGNLTGPIKKDGPAGGSHGFLPSVRAMNSSFFLVGPGIPAGRNLGQIDMRDIAPTLAALMGLRMTTDGHNVLQR